MKCLLGMGLAVGVDHQLHSPRDLRLPTRNQAAECSKVLGPPEPGAHPPHAG